MPREGSAWPTHAQAIQLTGAPTAAATPVARDMPDTQSGAVRALRHRVHGRIVTKRISVASAMVLSASRRLRIPEMVIDGATGLLVPPHDPAALAAAVTRALTDHPLADTLAQEIYDEGAPSVEERATGAPAA